MALKYSAPPAQNWFQTQERGLPGPTSPRGIAKKAMTLPFSEEGE
jgi:hypothetical protein